MTALPLPAREAVQALHAAWRQTNDAIQDGLLRILDHELWYANSIASKDRDVVEVWLQEEERALAEGYNGLRIAINTSFPTPESWSALVEYEHTVTQRCQGRPIVALCAYALPQCAGQRMNEVMQAHQCTFECSYADWQVVTTRQIVTQRKRAAASAR